MAKLRAHAIDASTPTRQESTTALTARLLELARAFHEELLGDEALLDYLDNFVEVCENQIHALEDIGFCSVSARGYTILQETFQGFIELAETLDTLTFGELRKELQHLESRIGFALYSLRGMAA